MATRPRTAPELSKTTHSRTSLAKPFVQGLDTVATIRARGTDAWPTYYSVTDLSQRVPEQTRLLGLPKKHSERTGCVARQIAGDVHTVRSEYQMSTNQQVERHRRIARFHFGYA